MPQIVFSIAIVAHAALLFLTTRLLFATSERIVAILLVALNIDNMILLLSDVAYGYDWYLVASQLRYALHVLVLPLLVVAVRDVAARAGISFAMTRAMVLLSWLVTGALLIVGISTELIGLTLTPTWLYGHARYVSVIQQLPVATIATNFIVLVVAAFIWYRSRWGWLFAGALFIFVVNGALASQPFSLLAGNLAEIVFAAAWVATLYRFRPFDN